MAKEEIKCKHCSSPEIKKTFLGGSGKLIGIIFIILGLVNIEANLATPKNMLTGLIFLLVGIAAIVTPKYECKSCRKKFS